MARFTVMKFKSTIILARSHHTSKLKDLGFKELIRGYNYSGIPQILDNSVFDSKVFLSNDKIAKMFRIDLGIERQLMEKAKANKTNRSNRRKTINKYKVVLPDGQYILTHIDLFEFVKCNECGHIMNRVFSEDGGREGHPHIKGYCCGKHLFGINIIGDLYLAKRVDNAESELITQSYHYGTVKSSDVKKRYLKLMEFINNRSLDDLIKDPKIISHYIYYKGGA